ncbi:MAG: hypothetical protein WAK17_18215 [Candidatus Nitrosopolaris sp.]|jgi:hypothetical protein
MTSVNQKTALVTIAAIAAVLAVNTIAIGNGRSASAATDVITKHFNNTGINVQTDTNQKQDCETAGGSSGIANSCTATSTDNVAQSGGIHHK